MTRRIGRYELHGEIASGGMGTVYYGRLLAPLGFARVVAVKKLHAHLAREREFVAMFVDEVRMAARVQHPNVVPTLDVVTQGGEAYLVMEHVLGEALSRLLRTARDEGEPVPPAVAASVACGLLHGLHAAHEAKGERGEPLRIVHRDVSPQNVLVGADGVTRLIDFGVAKAAGRIHTSVEGSVKGKIAYMAPEQLAGKALDRRADVYAAGAVLWEMLTGRRLVEADDKGASLIEALEKTAERPSAVRSGIPSALDDAVMRALAREREARFGTARQMAMAIESASPVASATQVSEWVRALAGDVLDARARAIAAIESAPASAEPAVVATDAVTVREHTTPRAGRSRWIPIVGVSSVLAVLAVAGVTASRGRTAARGAERPAQPPASAAEPAAASAEPASTLADAPPPTPAPRAGSAAPARAPHPSLSPVKTRKSAGDAGCRVQQYVDGDGLTHFRCVP